MDAGRTSRYGTQSTQGLVGLSVKLVCVGMRRKYEWRR